MTKKQPPITREQIGQLLAPDDAGLLTSLMQMADRSSLAVATLELIARRDERIEQLEMALNEATRALSGDQAFPKLPDADPMARFKDDVHPAITNARIAVHNAEIMGCLKRKDGESV